MEERVQNMRGLLFGVGINDSSYTTEKFEYFNDGGISKRKRVWFCPYYVRWRNMIERCYSKKYHTRKPSYSDCSVCLEWLTFSNFSEWMKGQNWSGLELDKDILSGDKKVYSPETCLFITKEVNVFMSSSNADSKAVKYSKRHKSYSSYCSNPITKTMEYVASSKDPEVCRGKWLVRKKQIALKLSAIQDDDRVVKAILTVYS